ncbi:hypothetical protein GZH53_17615 [Flavihumibacter sp. R14]|nr:hypothetical protein [Flavihumibacter soli]
MRKTILAFLLLAGITLGVKAQDDKTKVDAKDVPQEVMTAFSSTFANATDVEWKKKDADYNVSFEIGDVDQHAMFTSTGKLIYKGKEIKEAELPSAVLTSVKKDHAAYKIDEAWVIEKEGKTIYKISLDGSPDKKVKYSADGKMLETKEVKANL